MTSEDNEPAANDDLERRLDRLWNDRQSLPINISSDQQIGPYDVERAVGSGSFGIVYLAKDRRSGEQIALKVPRSEVLIDKKKLLRFAVEAEIVSELNHPNIVRFREANADGPIPWLATEWCDSSDLADWLQRSNSDSRASNSWTEAVELLRQVADAVDHVHQKGIAHRDLKPANIMLCKRDDSKPVSLKHFTPKVADFGLSKLHGDIVNTKSSVLVGTPIYMAPELIDDWRFSSLADGKGSFASDIYSLGAILFELLTGQPPVTGRSFHEILDNVRNARTSKIGKLCPHLPKNICQVVETCLSLNPDARYESAGDLAKDLQRCIDGSKIEGRSVSTSSQYRFWHSRQQWLLTAGRFALFSGMLIATWMTFTSVAAILYQVVPEESVNDTVKDFLLLITTSTIPMLLIGWMCLKGKRWAALFGALFNLGNLVAAVFGMLGRPFAFEGLYYSHDIYFCFTIHLFIFLCYIVQEALFVFGCLSSDPNS